MKNEVLTPTINVSLSNPTYRGPVGPEGPQGKVGPQGPQGEIGPQGPQGEPGKDYVLTSDDKAEIARLAIEVMPKAEEGEY